MPVRKVGSNCYKYGSSGKKYCGSGAKSKASTQGRAIKASQARQAKK